MDMLQRNVRRGSSTLGKVGDPCSIAFNTLYIPVTVCIFVASTIIPNAFLRGWIP
jgi:hypothetical protein